MSISKKWRFYAKYRDGRTITLIERYCVKPEMTKTWRDMLRSLDADETLEGVGYEPSATYSAYSF